LSTRLKRTGVNRAWPVIVVSSFLMIGCSEVGSSHSKESSGAIGATNVLAPASSPAEGMPPSRIGPQGLADASASMDKAGAGAGAGTDVPSSTPRRVIYNAQVDLVVESLSEASVQIVQLAKSHGGYVSETDTSMRSRSQRTGMWKLRVPVGRFEELLAALGKMGELQRSHLDSQDVSEEYYDLEARISNKQQEETRLKKHLDDSTGKLEDILAVERELTRVRGEVEQLQGRHRFLTNQTDLSTVVVSVIELKDYTPPASPGFVTELKRTFQRSIDDLAKTARNVVLAIVAMVPWLIPLLVLYFLLRSLVRLIRLRRSR